MINQAVLEWLARAQKGFPDVRILALCVLSNHLHLVVQDNAGELASWASYFLGNLARAVNRIRQRTGAFFERRYSAEPILDDDALLERIVYVVTNPVKARLCRRSRDWLGVDLFADAGVSREIPVFWIDRSAPASPHSPRAKTPRGAPHSQTVRSQIRLDPLPTSGIHDPGGERLRHAIEFREKELADERRRLKRRTLTPTQVLAQHWHAAPKSPTRSPRPLCHTGVPELRKAFREGFQHFVSLFREASERLRAGLKAVFPDWSYPPGCRLVRPVAATMH